MSDVELPQEWLDQGWTLESASEKDEAADQEWGASAALAAADPSTLSTEPGQGGEEGTAIG